MTQLIKPLGLVKDRYKEQLLPRKDGKYLALIIRAKYKADNPDCDNGNVIE